jgi:hypothetical protein
MAISQSWTLYPLSLPTEADLLNADQTLLQYVGRSHAFADTYQFAR